MRTLAIVGMIVLCLLLVAFVCWFAFGASGPGPAPVADKRLPQGVPGYGQPGGPLPQAPKLP
jgi:hypothetical protein